MLFCQDKRICESSCNGVIYGNAGSTHRSDSTRWELLGKIQSAIAIVLTESKRHTPTIVTILCVTAFTIVINEEKWNKKIISIGRKERKQQQTVVNEIDIWVMHMHNTRARSNICTEINETTIGHIPNNKFIK